MNSALGGSKVSLSRVLKMCNDSNTFGSCNLRFRAQFLCVPCQVRMIECNSHKLVVDATGLDGTVDFDEPS